MVESNLRHFVLSVINSTKRHKASLLKCVAVSYSNDRFATLCGKMSLDKKPFRANFFGRDPSRGCDEALVNEKKAFLSVKGGGIQSMRGLVRISTEKKI